MLPLIEREVNKLFEEKIIIALRHSRWLANAVLVSNKNEEIRICIDLRNLNRVSLKDNCPLQDGPHIAKSCRFSENVHAGWILWI